MRVDGKANFICYILYIKATARHEMRTKQFELTTFNIPF